MKKSDLSQWNSWAGRTSLLTWILALLQLLHTSYWVSVKATCNLKVLICDVSLPASSYFKDRNCYTDDILFPFLKKLLVLDHFFFKTAKIFSNLTHIVNTFTFTITWLWKDTSLQIPHQGTDQWIYYWAWHLPEIW